jgi:YD repeat-containing protein
LTAAALDESLSERRLIRQRDCERGGWAKHQTRPGSTALVNAYDANGNVITHTNRRGQQTSFGYDDMDRVTSRTADGATTTYSTCRRPSRVSRHLKFPT